MSVLNQIVRRGLAGLLAVVLLVGLSAVGAWAAEEAPPEDTYIEAAAAEEEAPEGDPGEMPEEPAPEEPAEEPADGSEDVREQTEEPEDVLPEPAEPAAEEVSPSEDDPWDDPLYCRIQAADDGIMTLASGKTYSNFTTRALKDGETLHKGIDVSEFQGSINWSKVAASGVEFVFVRVAYRGTGTGSLNQDSWYKTNLTGARAAGLKVGAYIFSQAISETEARAEAKYLVSLVKGYDLDLPLVIDYEYAGTPGRLAAAKLSRQTKTDVCNAFCAEVESSGYQSMVYANYSMLNSDMYAAQLKSRVWLAHYATSTGYPNAYEYWQCSDSGVVSGISGYVDLDFWFMPNVAPPSESTPGSTRFTDVTKSNWFYDTVMEAYEKGIVKGTTDTTFSPQTTASRGQVVTMVYRMMGEPETTATTGFTDLTADYYKDAVAWASANNVVTGYSDDRFAPNDLITREDLVTILYRLAGSPAASGSLDAYTDAGSVHSYAKAAMTWAVNKGIITGYTDNTVKPTDSATRAEVCTILMRYMEQAG